MGTELSFHRVVEVTIETSVLAVPAAGRSARITELRAKDSDGHAIRIVLFSEPDVCVGSAFGVPASSVTLIAPPITLADAAPKFTRVVCQNTVSACVRS